MGRTELPAAVRHLIEQHLHSAAAVDALLLLCKHDQAWSASGVARELRFDLDQTSNILSGLSRTGLLTANADTYRFDPRDPALADAVATLANLYPNYRLAVISLIYDPTRPIRDFSDAFRLRDED